VLTRLDECGKAVLNSGFVVCKEDKTCSSELNNSVSTGMGLIVVNYFKRAAAREACSRNFERAKRPRILNSVFLYPTANLTENIRRC
jgi:hypothetical protein